jgi:hypothetical protein
MIWSIKLLFILSYIFGVVSYKYELFPISTIKSIKNHFFPYQRELNIYEGFNDISNRVEIDCSKILDSNRKAIILIAGQSNAANSTNYKYTPKNSDKIYNYNFFDGKCYKSLDPLLGTSYSGGSSWNLLADKLLEDNIFDEVMLIPVAVGNTSIDDWNQKLFFRIENSIKDLRDKNIEISHIFWHQGEADNKRGTSKENYKREFLILKDRVRALNIKAPIFMAIASRDLLLNKANNYQGYSKTIQDAQKELITENRDIFLGANSDNIFDRYDFIHLSKDGAIKHSNEWFKVIKEFER